MLSPLLAAPQHGPRPLPLFIAMLRNETAASPERRAAALKGLAAYQAATRTPPPPPPPEIARIGRVALRDLGGTGAPVVFVPSLINPPSILDLPGRSLLRWLAERGHRALLVDWGAPGPADRDEDIAAHIERYLLPLLTTLGERPVLAGYCLGGTMAIAAARAADARALALIAAPWRFDRYGDAARGSVAALWQGAEATCERLGLVPMEVLQTGFWQLDPARTVAKFERFGALPPDSDAARTFVTLEDWANAGAPLTLAAGRAMFRDLFAQNLPGQGRWRVAGDVVDPAALSCPVIEFVASADRIVPAATAAAIAPPVAAGAGHVGMVIGSRAEAQLWQPLADWLSIVATTR